MKKWEKALRELLVLRNEQAAAAASCRLSLRNALRSVTKIERLTDRVGEHHPCGWDIVDFLDETENRPRGWDSDTLVEDLVEGRSASLKSIDVEKTVSKVKRFIDTDQACQLQIEEDSSSGRGPE